MIPIDGLGILSTVPMFSLYDFIAIGVPILLAYVYGVVPISLCRGGTCGVKNDNGTLSFDFSGGSGDNSGKFLYGIDQIFSYLVMTDIGIMLYDFDNAFRLIY